MRQFRAYWHPGVAVLSINAPTLVDGLEVVIEVAKALARTKKHQAAAVQRKVKQTEDFLLCGWLEIDEHVPAAHEIHTRKGRVSDDVVVDEHDGLAKIGHHLVAASSG